jgi:hypothetical protein
LPRVQATGPPKDGQKAQKTRQNCSDGKAVFAELRANPIVASGTVPMDLGDGRPLPWIYRTPGVMTLVAAILHHARQTVGVRPILTICQQSIRIDQVSNTKGRTANHRRLTITLAGNDTSMRQLAPDNQGSYNRRNYNS